MGGLGVAKLLNAVSNVPLSVLVVWEGVFYTCFYDQCVMLVTGHQLAGIFPIVYHAVC